MPVMKNFRSNSECTRNAVAQTLVQENPSWAFQNLGCMVNIRVDKECHKGLTNCGILESFRGAGLDKSLQSIENMAAALKGSNTLS
jgi:hypothetical protein